MNYITFNKWVFEYYRTTNTENNVCCLAIDEYVINQFKIQYSLSQLHFNEIKNFPWSKLLQTDVISRESVPRYFGLIALQCLAASSMENSDDLSSGNYNRRFCKIAGVDIAKLNSLYSETHNNQPIQDYIWKRAKTFLWNSFGFQISIPEGAFGPGRYIQYPKAQVVLNKQDLKEIGQKIFVDLENDDSLITEKDFEVRFLDKFVHSTFVRKNNQVRHIGPFKDIFLKQVFNYFNSNDWQFDNYYKSEHSSRKRRDKYVVEFGVDEKPHFYNDQIEISNPAEVFREKDTYIFRKLDTEEYEESSFFYLREELLIVSTLPLVFGETINHVYDNLNIIKCIFHDIEGIPQILINKLKDEMSSFPVKLEGIRVGHGWNYIQGFGPEIIGERYSVWYSRYEDPFRKFLLEDYNPFTCIPGLYTILIPGTKNLEFRILDYKCDVNNSLINGGLSLKNFVLNDGGALLTGLHLSGNLTDDGAITINKWVGANLGTRLSKSNFLKSIINYNHDR